MEIPYDDNIIHFDGARGIWTFMHGYMIDVRDAEILDLVDDMAIVDVGTREEAAPLLDMFSDICRTVNMPAPTCAGGPRIVLRCTLLELPDDITGDALLEFTSFTIEDGNFRPTLLIIGMKNDVIL